MFSDIVHIAFSDYDSTQLYFFTYDNNFSPFFDIEFFFYNIYSLHCSKCSPKINSILEHFFNLPTEDVKPLYNFYNLLFFS